MTNTLKVGQAVRFRPECRPKNCKQDILKITNVFVNELPWPDMYEVTSHNANWCWLAPQNHLITKGK